MGDAPLLVSSTRQRAAAKARYRNQTSVDPTLLLLLLLLSRTPESFTAPPKNAPTTRESWVERIGKNLDLEKGGRRS
jgi:hypothetical protein